MNTKDKITSMLKELGVPPHIRGYHYLDYALNTLAEKSDIIWSITKTLYPDIAEHFFTTKSRVERDIRHAVGIAFDNMSQETYAKYFGATVNVQKDRATNKQFIATLALRLK